MTRNIETRVSILEDKMGSGKKYMLLGVEVTLEQIRQMMDAVAKQGPAWDRLITEAEARRRKLGQVTGDC